LLLILFIFFCWTLTLKQRFNFTLFRLHIFIFLILIHLILLFLISLSLLNLFDFVFYLLIDLLLAIYFNFKFNIDDQVDFCFKVCRIYDVLVDFTRSTNRCVYASLLKYWWLLKDNTVLISHLRNRHALLSYIYDIIRFKYGFTRRLYRMFH